MLHFGNDRSLEVIGTEFHDTVELVELETQWIDIFEKPFLLKARFRFYLRFELN